MGSWLQHAGSLVVVCRFSHPTACGILVPPPGIEPVSPALQGRGSSAGPPGKSLHIILIHGLLNLGIWSPWIQSFCFCFLFLLLFCFYLKTQLYFQFLATPHGLWDLSSWIRDQTCTPCIGCSGPLDHQGSPRYGVLITRQVSLRCNQTRAENIVQRNSHLIPTPGE